MRRSPPWENRKTLLGVTGLALGVSTFETFRALSRLIRGLRVRGWNSLCRIASGHEHYYSRWVEVAEPKHFARYCDDREAAATPDMPACIVLGRDREAGGVKCSIESLRAAFGEDVPIWTVGFDYPNCRAFAQAPSVSLFEGLKFIDRTQSKFRWLLPVRAGDQIAVRARQILDTTENTSVKAPVMYWDSDEIHQGVRCNPWIKGDWDPLMYLARDTISGSGMLALETALEIAARRPDLMLDEVGIATLGMEMVAADPAVSPVHVPIILSHHGSPEDFCGNGQWSGIIARTWQTPVVATPREDVRQFHRVEPAAPPQWPSVAIIVPTRDRPELLAACLAGLARLEYPGTVELVIVDNGSTDIAAIELLNQLRNSGKAKLIREDGPFNFAALNNRAVEQTSAQLLCLLNNDVEALDGVWLTAMVRHAVQSQVGAVGALLFYPNGTIQHAGVTLGTGGAAGHFARHTLPCDQRFFAWHGVTRRVSATTAACMVVARDDYVAVGGLDEQAFPVAFNDIDFCLRLQKAGRINIFVAEARLIHHESVSRGSDHDPVNAERFRAELSRFRTRWDSANCTDPYFSPLFSRSAEQCLLAF